MNQDAGKYGEIHDDKGAQSGLQGNGATPSRWDQIHGRLEAVQRTIEEGNHYTTEQKRAILRARAKQMAQEPLRAKGNAPELEIVEFRMAHETYGFESRYIREVYPLKDYCPLPCTPAFVFGLVNVRGQLLSVLDLKKFFGLASQELDNHNQTIILHHGEMEIGILADALMQVTHVAGESLQPALPTLTGLRNEFLLGITPQRVIVLDAEKLLLSRDIIVYEEIEN
jgi:purine-binding chemotaxis protein CheW